jgi:RHH-type proline utilization regulon transcriptional repressor/proline dehydrogenase/delta 1-pyrroline-5-carboxylate dehydrogenase
LPPLLAQARLPADQAGQAHALAHRIAQQLRNRKNASGRAGLVQNLLQEYALSSQEGVALMCLAEALLRIPDADTRDALIRDKIAHGQWQQHAGRSPSLFVNAATWGLLLTGKLVATHSETGLSACSRRLVGKGGEPLIRKGVDMAMRMMGEQFVTGETIAQALDQRARAGGRGLSLFLRHAGRGGADGRRRAALPQCLRRRHPRHRQGVGRARHLRGAGHLDQAVGAAPALQPRAARA